MTLIGIKPYDKHKFKQEQEKLAAMRRMNGLVKLTQSSFGQAYDSKISSQYGAFGCEPEVLQEFIEQETRMGGFERIFPLEFNVNYYSQFFERDRPNNELLRKHICT